MSVKLKGRKLKQLTLAQFERAIQSLTVGQQVVDITKAVLVNGERQLDQAEAYGLTRGAVSQAVNRVWLAAEELKELPDGYEKITVILPEHRAFLVKKWASETRELLEIKP